MFFPFFKGFSGPNRNNGRNGEGFPDQGRQQDDQSRNHSNPEGECTNPDDDFEFDVDIQKGRVRTNDRVIAILILLLFFYIVYENGRNRQRQREPRRIRMIRNPDRIEELESEDEMDITQRPAIEDHQAEDHNADGRALNPYKSVTDRNAIRFIQSKTQLLQTAKKNIRDNKLPVEKCAFKTKIKDKQALKDKSEYADSITNGRVSALDENPPNKALALAFKTIGNCGGFGKAIEVVDRPSLKFDDEKQLARSIIKPTFKSTQPLYQENGEYSISEVTFEKKRIKDDKPTVLGVAILQNSKLHFLSFVYKFLHKYLKPGSYKLNYCDTDSLAISFTRSEECIDTNRSKMMTSFLPCVHQELKYEFLQECGKWLVLENTNLNEKTPGLLKSEWETDSGALVCLGNKMYFGYDPKNDKVKRSTKGVPHNQELKLQEFLDCLYGNIETNNRFTLRTLRPTTNNVVKRVSTEKVLLSNLFVKMRVMDDGITCEPLTLDGKPL
ncbi:Oidioi.mRNA.OKI2018_I69.PAR.g12434.t1.cds [Oikopleura dioica]|uniref:Oidioi.mRNA.OKI2018_I69.PAR.g12434.t1.cds n=1 Tax=Oikopleura dioica TaxID=34765 RepID=A0ABN7S5P5_OIKDI|nr:Oidioi.mRNA.OKI2018_I69.PAR.g12434.t1.cds [Oikopleura dioica]